MFRNFLVQKIIFSLAWFSYEYNNLVHYPCWCFEFTFVRRSIRDFHKNVLIFLASDYQWRTYGYVLRFTISILREWVVTEILCMCGSISCISVPKFTDSVYSLSHVSYLLLRQASILHFKIEMSCLFLSRKRKLKVKRIKFLHYFRDKCDKLYRSHFCTRNVVYFQLLFVQIIHSVNY